MITIAIICAAWLLLGACVIDGVSPERQWSRRYRAQRRELARLRKRVAP